MSKITNPKTIARRRVVARKAREWRCSVGVASTRLQHAIRPATVKRWIAEELASMNRYPDSRR